MSAQLNSHPHLYNLICWFEKEELLVRELSVKIGADIPVHRRKRAPMTVLRDHALEILWSDYSAGKIQLQELLVQSTKWIASKV